MKCLATLLWLRRASNRVTIFSRTPSRPTRSTSGTCSRSTRVGERGLRGSVRGGIGSIPAGAEMQALGGSCSRASGGYLQNRTWRPG